MPQESCERTDDKAIVLNRDVVLWEIYCRARAIESSFNFIELREKESTRAFLTNQTVHPMYFQIYLFYLNNSLLHRMKFYLGKGVYLGWFKSVTFGESKFLSTNGRAISIMRLTPARDGDEY